MRTALNNQVIVGSCGGPGLTNIKLWDVGGTETHVLSNSEMPHHSNNVQISVSHTYEHSQNVIQCSWEW